LYVVYVEDAVKLLQVPEKREHTKSVDHEKAVHAGSSLQINAQALGASTAT
jgi:hypothetical protein